jgi:hypothetical protein
MRRTFRLFALQQLIALLGDQVTVKPGQHITPKRGCPIGKMPALGFLLMWRLA